MIRVVLPYHLKNLAKVHGEVHIELNGNLTIEALLDALEQKHPVLKGTIRDQNSLRRRPFIRFFACREDFSNEPPGAHLPPEVVSGEEPFLVVGAMAGG